MIRSMPKSKPAAVFTFETPRQALAAEEVLRRERIDLEEVPPPPEAEGACDIAIRIPLSGLYEALGAMATDNAEWAGVYQLGEQQEVVARLG
jgi:hypothetical protein